jgi:regulator of RNase E activity RraA
VVTDPKPQQRKDFEQMAETRGFVVHTKVDRPAPELVAPFKDFCTCNVGDALGRFAAMDYRIKPMVQGWKMAGPAITLRTRPCDNLLVYKALEMAQPGDVLVISYYETESNSVWGDLTSAIGKAKGMAGMVTDGVVRDLAGLREVGLPVFAIGLTPNSPQKDGPGPKTTPFPPAPAEPSLIEKRRRSKPATFAEKCES